MVIADSSVWIDYFASRENEHTVWLERLMGRSVIGLTDRILMEILQGVREDTLFRRIRDELTQGNVFDTGGQELAIAAAGNYRILRALGYTVRKPVDSLIATFCMANGHSLLHRDRDFDAFEQHLGLQVIHPVRR